jgi:uncharacterized low-complexity protein
MAEKSITTRPLAAAVGVAFVSSLAASTAAHAADNPFEATDLDAGYLLAGADKAEEGTCGGDKAEEGKCGEGKCGAEKAEEGACGGDKAEEGTCGGDKAEEGTCGGDKD